MLFDILFGTNCAALPRTFPRLIPTGLAVILLPGLARRDWRQVFILRACGPPYLEVLGGV